MEKNEIEKIKKMLEKEKSQVEKELTSFADKDENLKGDWDTRFPKWDEGEKGSDEEIAADEVAEYSRLLPLEYVLENRLKSIETALERIKKGNYGVCEKCKKKIPLERIKIYPEAKYCLDCKKKIAPQTI